MDEKVLIVDDDTKLRSLLKDYLEGYGFVVHTLPDGSRVEETVRLLTPDAVILDVMMPGRDGLSVLQDFRREFSTPVIMLTAKGEDADRIVGLELGADDYLPKPFNPRELLARIRAVLRRMKVVEETVQTVGSDIRAGGLVLDQARRTLWVESNEAPLSATEFKILETLMRRPETVFSRDDLMNAARGRDAAAFDRSIDVHISNLRAKLKPHPKYRKCIKTVWGAGYMFVEPK